MTSENTLTGKQRFFGNDEIIVTKTDINGKISYANDIFVNISGYSERELLGNPHSMIRHPIMPRVIFKLLWSRIQSGHEIFSYIVNRCKNGDHYWVLAHVTPNLDSTGQTIGYHSSRRMTTPKALEAVTPLYKELQGIENSGDRKISLEKSWAALPELISKKGFPSYDRFIMSLVQLG